MAEMNDDIAQAARDASQAAKQASDAAREASAAANQAASTVAELAKIIGTGKVGPTESAPATIELPGVELSQESQDFIKLIQEREHSSIIRASEILDWPLLKPDPDRREEARPTKEPQRTE